MRFKLLLLGALVLPGAAWAGADQPGAPLIAADRAFAAAARTTGEWTAFRAFAALHAEIFVPQRIRLSELGKDRSDPAAATRWSPEHAWVSCDGTAGVTFGRWHLPGSHLRGWYEAVWGQVTGGGYKVLLRRAGPQPRQLLSKPGLKGVRAACSGQPGLPISAPAEGTDLKIGASRDQTLIWSSAADRAGAVTIAAAQWDGVRHVPVLRDAAPAANAR